MSSPTRWDPFRDVLSPRDATSLRDAMSQLVEQAVMRPGFAGAAPWALAGGTYGQMNVFEAQGMYVAQVLLPGVSPEDIELSARQNTLTLKVNVPEPIPEEHRKNVTYLLHEFGAGEFTRSLSFPKDVNADSVQATYEGGILTIEIPVAQHAQPRRITVSGAKGQKGQQRLQPSSAQPKHSSQQVVESQRPTTAGAMAGPNGRETTGQ